MNTLLIVIMVKIVPIRRSRFLVTGSQSVITTPHKNKIVSKRNFHKDFVIGGGENLIKLKMSELFDETFSADGEVKESKYLPDGVAGIILRDNKYSLITKCVNENEYHIISHKEEIFKRFNSLRKCNINNGVD